VAHTVFCLVPAFFIAGAMSSMLPKDGLLPYLGKKTPKYISYPISIISGLLLAVCSCTVLPLFAGIRKRGAGLGPALAFLYTAPATNIIAILYTASLIGWDIAIARIILSILFAIIVGIIISGIFPEQPGEEISLGKKPKAKTSKRRLVYLFAALLAILLVGTRISEELPKYGLTALLVLLTYFISKKYFTKDEISSWMDETWGFTKTIFPLLLGGVFLSGIIRVLLPQNLISGYLGGNGFFAMAIPVTFGIFVYFPTLVEVPMAKTFLQLGMSRAALLAYLLADPVISLPSILVMRRIIGDKRTLLYIALIFILTVSAGMLYGRIS